MHDSQCNAVDGILYIMDITLMQLLLVYKNKNPYIHQAICMYISLLQGQPTLSLSFYFIFYVVLGEV